jgi:O-antigen/teichoic acid export membrane protein
MALVLVKRLKVIVLVTLFWQMKLKESQLYKLVTDVVKIATSTQRLKQLWGIRFYSNALYLMMTSVITSLLGFAFWIVVARFYTVQDVGLASATIAAMGLVAAYAHLGLGMGLIRFLPHSGENANSMINTAFTINILASIVGAFIFIAGLGFWSPALLFLRQNPIYLAAFVIFTIASSISNLTGNTFIAERRAGFIVGQNLIFSLLKLPLPILLAVFFHSFGIFASWGISLCIALLLCFFLFLPRVQPGYRPFFAVNRKVVNNIMHFSFANYLANLLWGVPTLVLPIMVINLSGAELAAYFYIAWAIASAPAIVSGALSTSLFAEGSHDEDGVGLNIWRSLKISFLTLMPAVILILAIADKLLILFGSSYSENATTLLRILAISALPLTINIIYLDVKRVEKKLKVLVGLSGFAAVVTLGLTYLLLPRMGINGAGIAWLATQGIIALVVIGTWLKGRTSQRRRSNEV